jgi:ceramide glucosyltransferase
MTAIAATLVVLSVISAGYWAWASYSVARFARRRSQPVSRTSPVSVLKPLRGDHPLLYESLRSFCEQDHPSFEIVFGVSDPLDPAAAVVRRLIDDFPDLDIVLVTDAHTVGANPKVSNVVNLYKSARHDLIVLADSDVRVAPDYLRTVVAPLADRGTGLVTCLYRARPLGGLPSTLGAMYINGWFFPSAVVACGLEPLAYAFGATVASRREVLDVIGGFARVADYLADDYVLGRAVAQSGRRVQLSPHVVETLVAERDFKTLIAHELRWARTIRSVRPLGYLLSVVTFGVPLSLLAVACGGVTTATMGALIANVSVRLAAGAVLPGDRGGARWWRIAWLVPVRDVLSFAVWLLSFCGRTVCWYGERFTVGPDSHLRRPRP